MHDALAFASMVVGDSQTMAAEAAVLGTPSLRTSTFAGRLGYLNELEQRYHLTRAFCPEETQQFLDTLESWLADHDLAVNLRETRPQTLSEKINVANWFVDFASRLIATLSAKTSGQFQFSERDSKA